MAPLLAHSIFFGIIFALSVAELCFAIDAFVYLQEQHKWWSGTEKARMGFLIFSCVRTIFLSGAYTAAHFFHVKNLLDTMHTVSLPPFPGEGTLLMISGSDLPCRLDHFMGHLGRPHLSDVDLRRVPKQWSSRQPGQVQERGIWRLDALPRD